MTEQEGWPRYVMYDEHHEWVVYAPEPDHELQCADGQGGECGRRCSCLCHTRARRARPETP